MTAMATVHEYVHQRASEQEEIGDGAQDVGAVLLPQQHQGNRGEAKEHQKGPRGPEAPLRPSVRAMMAMVVCHVVAPVIRQSGGPGTCPSGTQRRIRRASWV